MPFPSSPSSRARAYSQAFAVYCLHCVDFVEHAGLVREGGTRAKVRPEHSWNSNFMATNAVTFRLQRHSDHHAHAERPYHKLRDMPGQAPYLPASYPAMILLAQSPRLWRAVMIPHIERAREAARARAESEGEGGHGQE